MAEVVLFHHAQGLTAGVAQFADQLRAAGHTVHVPDLFEGRTFPDIDTGVSHAEDVGFETIIERGVAAVIGLSEQLVYAGFSLGALPAQKLAQTRPGAQAALLYHGGVPTSVFGVGWSVGVPLQLHIMEDDPWSEIDVAQELVAETSDAKLFLYPGAAHLFADSTLPDFEPEAADLLMQRTLDLLANLD